MFLKSKYKIFSAFLAVICLSSILRISFVASAAPEAGDYSEQDSECSYPCYCESCVQQWNDYFTNYDSTPSFACGLTSLSGSAREFDGLHMLIIQDTSENELFVVFYDSCSFGVPSYGSDVDYYSIIFNLAYMSPVFSFGEVNLSSHSMSDYSYISYLRFNPSDRTFSFSSSNSPSYNGFCVYIDRDQPVLSSSSFYTYFLYPDSPYIPNEDLSDDPIEESSTVIIPGSGSDSDSDFYIISWLRIVSAFVIKHPLVLLVFALSIVGGIIGIFKRIER